MSIAPRYSFETLKLKRELEKYLYFEFGTIPRSNEYSLSNEPKERGDLDFKILIIYFPSIFFRNVEVEEELEKYLHISISALFIPTNILYRKNVKIWILKF